MTEYVFTYDTPAPVQIPQLGQIYADCFGDRPHGAFVEVGAMNGTNWSNVLPLAKLGWRGLLVEPNPEWAPALTDLCTQYPNVAWASYACGSYPGEASLFLAGSTSTVLQDTQIAYTQEPELACGGLANATPVTVPVITLTALLAQCDWPAEFEVLSVDVDGMELDVLRGLQVARFRPRCVVVETHREHPNACLNWKAIPIGCLLSAWGMEMVHSDIINEVWVLR